MAVTRRPLLARDPGTRRWGSRLVEPLIVLSAIGILSAVVVPHYSRGMRDTADGACVRRQLQVLRGQVCVFRAERAGADPDMTAWKDLLEGDFIGAAPRNALNGSTHVRGAGDFSGGWVWRIGETGRMQLYATNADHSGEIEE